MSTRLTFAYVKPSRVFSATGTNLFYTEGNVGIGLTNPTSTFEVNGNVNIDSGALFVNSANNNVGINTTTPTTALDVSGATTISGNLNVDNNTLFVDAASNRVGIGMNNPSAALHLASGNFMIASPARAILQHTASSDAGSSVSGRNIRIFNNIAYNTLGSDLVYNT